MTTDLSNYNDYQLKIMLSNIEQEGKHAKALLQAGNEAYRPKHVALRDRWKAVKSEINRRASAPAAGLSPAAPAAAPAPVTAKDFHRMCAQHDWNHEYSDDPGAYHAGKQSEARLHSIANDHPNLQPILRAWQEHVVAGGPRPVEPQA